MSAAHLIDRRLVLGLAALAYAGVFSAYVLADAGPVGIGHFFYIPVCLVALAGDLLSGALAGVLAAGLYALAAAVTAGGTAQALGEATAVRVVTYTLVGALVGWYASGNRALVARLRSHATQDFLTDLGNARVFDEQLARRCALGRPFTLVLADMDDLKQLNDVHGHEAGNAALRRIGEALRGNAHRGDEISRIGGDEFAILTALPPDAAATACARLSRTLAAEELHLSFGTTSYPEDGTTSVELFRKADDRLFAAKLVSRNRRTIVALHRV